MPEITANDIDVATKPANKWTTDRPKETGFYWYREDGMEPEVVRWDADMQWVQQAGNDVAWGDDLEFTIDGEFWPERLTPPLTYA